MSSIQAVNAAADASAGDEPLSMLVTESEFETVVTLSTAGDIECSQLLYDVTFDPDNYSVGEVVIADCLGTEHECVSASFTKTPGKVSLGQVRFGLSSVQVDQGTCFATIHLEPGPSRLPSVTDYEAIGLKLRINQEFTHSDVPFQVTNLGDNNFEVIWEEANDGDFDRNSLVCISDLTPIGMYFNMSFIEDIHYEENATQDAWELMRGSKVLRNTSIKSISTASSWPSGSDDYCPVDKHCNDVGDPVYYNDSEPTWYPVTISDITPIGQNWQHYVTGYRIYAVNTVPGYDPIPSNLIGTPVLLAEVTRPSSMSEKINNLGMGEYNAGGHDYTYSEFCQNCFSGDMERNGEVPCRAEPRIFRKTVTVPNTLPGDVYIVVTPNPGFEYLDLAYTDPGAYTYYPTKATTLPLDQPTSITWLNGETGIQEIQRGNSVEWPEGTEHQFRITFGEAEMNNHAYYTGEGWEVQYAVYISRNPNTIFDQDAVGFPVNHFYPSNNNQRQCVIDLGHPGGWMEFVDNPGEANTTMYVGVRAYPVKEYSDTCRVALTGLDTNTISDNVTLGPPIPPPTDESMPDPPVSYWASYLFNPAWVLTDEYTEWYNEETDEWWYGYVGLPLFRGHRDNPNNPSASGYFYPCSWVQQCMVESELGDLDQYGDPREIEELQCRVEYFRTTLDEQGLQAQIAAAGGIVPWLRTYVYCTDVFALTMSSPLYQDEYLEDFLECFMWYSEDWQSEIYNLNPCPPYPWCGLLKDDFELDDYYSITLGYNLDMTGMYHSAYAWQIGDYDWELYDPPAEIKCDGGFYIDAVDMVKFVYDPAYEFDYGLPYNYFSVIAINDPENNCRYADNIAWHGPVCQTELDAWTIFDFYSDYEYEYYCSVGDTYQTGDYYRDPSTTLSTLDAGSQQVRYPDIAYDATRNVIGVSLYDPNHGWCNLRELNLTANTGLVQKVDDASYGDTSLTYDGSGNPHVAYYKVTDSTTGLPVEQGMSTSSSVSSIRSASTTYGGGIKYRGRFSNIWGTDEDVDDHNVLNSAEHNIHFNSISGDPFCIIPTVDNADPMWNLGIPGYSEPAIGTSWDVDPLGTSETVTNMTLDSFCEIERGVVNTYVAYYSAVSSSLHLGTYFNQSNWSTVLLDSDNVKGYPSIARMPNGNIGVSYMAGADNMLRYGEWDGVGFTIIFESGMPDGGYQTALSYDTSGNPIIYSLNNQGQVIESKCGSSGRWVQFGVGLADTDELLEENTLSLARVNGGDWLAFIGPQGTLRLLYLPYN